MIKINALPSVMTEVPEPFALVVTLADSFMLGCFPTLRLPR